MKFKKIKHKIMHPYAQKEKGFNLSKEIEVEVEGEVKNGVPHGLCYLKFFYNGELESKYQPLSGVVDDPLLDGQHCTFRGTGVFVNGVLSGGPALFSLGNG
jgi:hypothetical protein